MADVITRFRVESSEYDNKLRKVTESMQRIEQEVRRTGATFEIAEKEEVEFVRSLGQMETKATSAKGKVTELTNSFTELSLIYKRMSDAEKQADTGKALRGSLDQLKTRVTEAKVELQSIQGELGGTSNVLDMIAGKIGIPTDLLSKFGLAAAAVTTAMKVMKDAFLQTEQGIDDWGRVMKSGESAYSTFLDTLNNGNWSGFFHNLTEAIRGAKQLYNEMDRLGSIKANNAAAIAEIQATIQELRLRQSKGENVVKELREAENRLKSLQLQSATQGKAAGRAGMAETIRRTAASMEGANVSTDDINKAVEDLLHSGQDAFDAFRKQAEELQQKGMVRTIVGMEADTGRTLYGERFDISKLTQEEQAMYKLSQAITQAETQLQQGISVFAQAAQEASNANREAFRAERYALQGERKQAASNATIAPSEESLNSKQINQLTDEYVSATDERRRAIEEEIKVLQARNAEIKRLKDLAQGKVNVTVSREFEKAQNALVDAQRRLSEARETNDLKGQLAAAKAIIEAQKELDRLTPKTFTVNADTGDIEEKLQNIQGITFDPKTLTVTAETEAAVAALQQVEGITLTPKTLTVTADTAPAEQALQRIQTDGIEVAATFTTGNMDAFISMLKEDLSHADVGSDLFSNLNAQLADASALSNLIKVAVKNGLDPAQINPQALWHNIFSGIDIPDDTWIQLAAQINEQLKSLGLDPIELNVQVGGVKQVSEDVTKMQGEWVQAAQAVGQFASALQSVEDPTAKVAGIIAEAIASIAAGAGAAVAKAGEDGSAGGPWGWIAFAISAAATTVSTIAAIKNATKFEHGGMVDGNHFHGDNIVARLNSGEGVLTAKGVNNAATLEGIANSRASQPASTSFVTGEMIILGVNNHLARTGQGEIVTTQMLRRAGINL